MVKRSREELLRELVEQRAALRASATGYDSGRLWEAKRLATSAYILLHDGTGRTKSLLGLVGAKKQLQFVNTARELYTKRDGQWVLREAVPTILYLKLTPPGWHENGGYFPNFTLGQQSPRSLSGFTRWWEDPIFETRKGLKLSRKNLVFHLRSQDGGSHVDEEITNESYAAFRTIGDPDFKLMRGDTQVTNLEMHLTSMRQIAWEIEETFKLRENEQFLK